MYHLDNTSGVPEMPEPKEEQSINPRWFGESQEQGGISWPGADWFNTVQAELLNLLEAAGIQPEKKAFDQLSKAIPVLGEKQIRQDLSSDNPGLGGSLVALKQGGTLQDALHNVINVEAFRGVNTSDDDWGPAFRAAIRFAASVGVNEVRFKGNYTIRSTDSTWVLPFDDGTVSPDRIAAGTETNLPPEEQIPMPVHIELPYGMCIRSDDPESNSLTFTWDYETVNTQQPVAFVGRVKDWDGTYVAAAGASNRLSAKSVLNQLEGFTIKRAFIGYVSDGIAQWVNWSRAAAFVECGIAVTSPGMDHCELNYVHGKHSFAGILSGGWWLTRNAGNYPQSKLPPYPAADIQASGWNDFVYINSMMFEGKKDTWTADSVYAKIDEFFDYYFYKTRHSVKPEDGGTGRMTTLTNSGSDAYAAVEADPFRGVAGRAYYFLSRGMHENKNIFLSHIKVHGCHRIPICGTEYQTAAWAGLVTSCYIERVPFTDTTRTSGADNDFYSSPLNKYNTTWPYGNASRIKLYTKAPAIAVQGKLGVKICHPSNSVWAKSTSGGVDITSSPSRHTVFADSLTGVSGEALEQTGIQTETVYSTVYSLWRQMAYLPPLSFTHSNYNTRDTEEVLFNTVAYKNSKTPISHIANGATDGSANVALGGNSFLSWLKTRNQVEAKFFLQLPSGTAGFTGTMYIPMAGLPVPLMTISAGVLGNTVPDLSVTRASYKTPTTPAITAAFTLGTDGEYRLTLNKDSYASSRMSLSEFNADTYLVVTVRYTANN
ncbi:Uncharacterised protein [Klebsiella pneumoniae]|uniref:hypothetical protein n=1 Tax=Klebsiella pneumoniae TaxID=573 RepID=UPI0010D82B74|nr:hypothetical protein [Klebsiella pneumoniae]VGC68664.1 Uncharacterised protein [Klebsiella pneumoniae]